MNTKSMLLTLIVAITASQANAQGYVRRHGAGNTSIQQGTGRKNYDLSTKSYSSQKCQSQDLVRQIQAAKKSKN